MNTFIKKQSKTIIKRLHTTPLATKIKECIQHHEQMLKKNDERTNISPYYIGNENKRHLSYCKWT